MVALCPQQSPRLPVGGSLYVVGALRGVQGTELGRAEASGVSWNARPMLEFMSPTAMRPGHVCAACSL